MRPAYDSRPGTMKERIENLVAEHRLWHSRTLACSLEPHETERTAKPPAQHMIVRRPAVLAARG